MKSISIRPGARDKGRGLRGNARGVAEVELVLVIPILLAILMMMAGAMDVGYARIHNAYDARNNVYTQVVSGQGFTAAGDPVPPQGIAVPLLPDRYAISHSQRVGTIIPGGTGPNPTSRLYSDQAIMQDAAWHYSAWPQTADRPALQAWFADYVEQSHPADVVQALGLQPPGPP